MGQIKNIGLYYDKYPPYRKEGKRPETEEERAVRKEKEWISFKLFFYINETSSDPYEIQKIFVPKKHSNSFSYLKEKIRRNFGEKLPNGMKIYWNDQGNLLKGIDNC